jgi:hypothetical protein
MLAACVASWKWAYTKPTTGCGPYGCSREVISSAESFTFTDARAIHAWQFARALGIAERHGWSRFVSMQNVVNLLVPIVQLSPAEAADMSDPRTETAEPGCAVKSRPTMEAATVEAATMEPAKRWKRPAPNPKPGNPPKG